MRIQYKLSITFILLLVFGVTAISSYSIVFIRGYLMSEAELNMEADAAQIRISLENSSPGLHEMLGYIGRETVYNIRIWSRDGMLTETAPGSEYLNETNPNLQPEIAALLAQMASENPSEPVYRRSSDRFFVYYLLNDKPEPAEYSFLEVSRLKSEIYRPVHTIRWIIYSGMFISIAIILFVSFIFSQYLAQPILALTRASMKIADGDTTQIISLNRTDEFGTLAQSINKMAARLQEDNKQLVRSSERQKQFYADISHEIRNPLHTISGTLEILQLDNLSQEKRNKFMKSAHNQVERLNRLFQDLMTLQKSDLDSNFIQPKPFLIGDLADGFIQIYQQMAQSKGLDFQVTGNENILVYADKDRIAQVLDNLVSNAIKYTPEGAVQVSWTTSGQYVEISVSDSGIGIQKEHIPNLFDRFYRTDKARSRDSGGTGLGLAVVKSILDAHQSVIEIDSSPGTGTSIRFTLPAGKGIPQQ
ncbi:MAG: HAMP domain-containing histidine kinase [Balneolales bacterium]|nr:HAMP domain-containing histidine kinase [Balneolales bacterium]